jgi:hypothetical protein
MQDADLATHLAPDIAETKALVEEKIGGAPPLLVRQVSVDSLQSRGDRAPPRSMVRLESLNSSASTSAMAASNNKEAISSRVTDDMVSPLERSYNGGKNKPTRGSKNKDARRQEASPAGGIPATARSFVDSSQHSTSSDFGFFDLSQHDFSSHGWRGAAPAAATAAATAAAAAAAAKPPAQRKLSKIMYNASQLANEAIFV